MDALIHNATSSTPERRVSIEEVDYRVFLRQDVMEKIARSDLILRHSTYLAEKLADTIGAYYRHQAGAIVFIHGYNGAPEGMIIYSREDTALVYIESALIGYQGSGPSLTKQILLALGLAESAFNTLNSTAQHRYPSYAYRMYID